MRRAAALATLTAAVSVLTVAPAMAAPAAYGNAYTYWNESYALTSATHTATAARTGAVSASASAPADRPRDWNAISSGNVVKTFNVGPNPYGYVVTATFTGISASSTGSLASGSRVIGRPSETAADVSLNAHYSGECMSGGAPCYTAATIVDGNSSRATVTFTLPGASAKTMIAAYAASDAWVRPAPDGTQPAAATARVSATVASITVQALTGPPTSLP